MALLAAAEILASYSGGLSLLLANVGRLDVLGAGVVALMDEVLFCHDLVLLV